MHVKALKIQGVQFSKEHLEELREDGFEIDVNKDQVTIKDWFINKSFSPQLTVQVSLENLSIAHGMSDAIKKSREFKIFAQNNDTISSKLFELKNPNDSLKFVHPTTTLVF
jgi:hypothetical protein